MKKLFFMLIVATLAVPAWAGTCHYVSADQVKQWIESGDSATIVDIQVSEEFSAHHIKGSMATYAYPVKTDDERNKLNEAVAKVKNDNAPVVIVCPRGKGGAKRCYDYMAVQGVPADRLLILENGMAGWPYKELVETR